MTGAVTVVVAVAVVVVVVIAVVIAVPVGVVIATVADENVLSKASTATSAASLAGRCCGSECPEVALAPASPSLCAGSW